MSYAILPLIIATIISVFFVYRIEKKIPTIPILGAVVVALFGGLTIDRKSTRTQCNSRDTPMSAVNCAASSEKARVFQK